MAFGAEIGKVLRLMIHSVYTNKDIFIRELLSNAGDAIEKRRYYAKSDQSLGNEGSDKITINVDTKDYTVAIRDTGIGMDMDDLINNLGTIAKSGTEEFLNRIEDKKNIDLIGQFGVGFYAAFMVASNIEVITRKAGSDNVLLWTSNGDDGYSISDVKFNFDTGTEVKIFLKEEDRERYLDKFALEHIAKTYSSNMSADIQLIVDRSSPINITNRGALWSRDKKEITEAEYKEFYKSLSHLPDSPSVTMHYKVEGHLEFTTLLFIPSMKPFDLFHPDRATRVKLYVKKVFINETGLDIIPKYLRFVYGVVDSADLPLNISRETLQNSAVLHKISDIIVKKVVGELKHKIESDTEAYQKIWTNFGSVIKEGLCEASLHRDDLLEICQFHTSSDTISTTSLKDYVSRMLPNQKDIYYCIGDSVDEILQNPQLEAFKKQNIEVLLFTDTVDGFWVNVISDYKGHEIKSTSRDDIHLDTSDSSKSDKDSKNNKHDDIHHREMTDAFAGVLQDLVAEVKISHKLVDSPACLAIKAGAMDAKLERILVEQKQLHGVSKKILEINPSNKLIQSAYEKLSSDMSRLDGENMVKLIFEITCISQGEGIKNPGSFARRLVDFIESVVK